MCLIPGNLVTNCNKPQRMSLHHCHIWFIKVINFRLTFFFYLKNIYVHPVIQMTEKDIVRFMLNMNQVNPPQRNGDIASKNIWLIDFIIYTSSQGIVMKKKARAWQCFRGIDRWRAVSKTLNDILYWMHWQFSLTSPQRNVKNTNVWQFVLFLYYGNI